MSAYEFLFAGDFMHVCVNDEYTLCRAIDARLI